MASQPTEWLTPEEYLKHERAAETKSEYIDGMLVAMAGASLSHILITVNIAGELRQQFKGRPCQVECTHIPTWLPSAVSRQLKLNSWMCCSIRR
jgi:Uma2 family endonuclease